MNIITTLEFLKSINDDKEHQLKSNDVFSAFNGDDEAMMILKLIDQGLVDCLPSNNGKDLGIKSYWITDKGKQYIKEHSKTTRFKKIF